MDTRTLPTIHIHRDRTGHFSAASADGVPLAPLPVILTPSLYASSTSIESVVARRAEPRMRFMSAMGAAFDLAESLLLREDRVDTSRCDNDVASKTEKSRALEMAVSAAAGTSAEMPQSLVNGPIQAVSVVKSASDASTVESASFSEDVPKVIPHASAPEVAPKDIARATVAEIFPKSIANASAVKVVPNTIAPAIVSENAPKTVVTASVAKDVSKDVAPASVLKMVPVSKDIASTEARAVLAPMNAKKATAAAAKITAPANVPKTVAKAATAVEPVAEQPRMRGRPTKAMVAARAAAAAAAAAATAATAAAAAAAAKVTKPKPVISTEELRRLARRPVAAVMVKARKKPVLPKVSPAMTRSRRTAVRSRSPLGRFVPPVPVVEVPSMGASSGTAVTSTSTHSSASSSAVTSATTSAPASASVDTSVATSNSADVKRRRRGSVTSDKPTSVEMQSPKRSKRLAHNTDEPSDADAAMSTSGKAPAATNAQQSDSDSDDSTSGSAWRALIRIDDVLPVCDSMQFSTLDDAVWSVRASQLRDGFLAATPTTLRHSHDGTVLSASINCVSSSNQDCKWRVSLKFKSAAESDSSSDVYVLKIHEHEHNHGPVPDSRLLQKFFVKSAVCRAIVERLVKGGKVKDPRDPTARLLPYEDVVRLVEAECPGLDLREHGYRMILDALKPPRKENILRDSDVSINNEQHDARNASNVLQGTLAGAVSMNTYESEPSMNDGKERFSSLDEMTTGDENESYRATRQNVVGTLASAISSTSNEDPKFHANVSSLSGTGSRSSAGMNPCTENLHL